MKRNKDRAERATYGQAGPLPLPKEGDAQMTPLPTPREAATGMTPLPAPPKEATDEATSLTAESDDSLGSTVKAEAAAITRQALDYYVDRSRFHYTRLGNLGAAFAIAGRELQQKAIKRNGVFHLRPKTPIERYLSERTNGIDRSIPVSAESPDVAAARRAWDDAKRSGDPDAMTRTANLLLRLKAQETERGSAPKTASEILNPAAAQRAQSRHEQAHRLDVSSSAHAYLSSDADTLNRKAASPDSGEHSPNGAYPVARSSDISDGSPEGEGQVRADPATPERSLLVDSIEGRVAGEGGIAQAHVGDIFGPSELSRHAPLASSDDEDVSAAGSSSEATARAEPESSGANFYEASDRMRLLPNTWPGTICRNNKCWPARHSLQIDDQIPPEIRRVESEAIAREYGPFTTVDTLKRRGSYHQYYLETRISAPGKSCAQVTRQMQIRAVPQAAYKRGPWRNRPPKTDDWTWVWARPSHDAWFPLPGGYVYHYDDRRTGAIVNMTTALHPLNPGYIIRWVTCEKNGTFVIHTLGRGTGNLGAINESVGPNMFFDLDTSVAQDLGGQVLPPSADDAY